MNYQKYLLFFIIAIVSNCEKLFINQAVTQLNKQNFQNINGQYIISKNKSIIQQNWFIMFYLTSCFHCKKAMPKWGKLAISLLKQPLLEPTKIGIVNCITNKDLCNNLKISHYPTILFFNRNNRRVTYEGQRQIQSYRYFLSQISTNPIQSISQPRYNIVLNSVKRVLNKITWTGYLMLFLMITLFIMLVFILFDKEEQKTQKSATWNNQFRRL